MMMTFTRKRSLSLGFRYRCFLAFAVLLPALLSGVTAAWAEAPIYDWAKEGGTVEVSEDKSSTSLSSLTFKEGERKKTYFLRLTKPLPAGEEGWWVRVHVNGAVRIDGFYPDGTERHNRNNKLADISWVPSVGWEFDSGDWESGQCQGQGGVQCVSKWRGVTITAYKDVETPIRFMHDVLDAQSECPDDLKGLGKLFVSTIGTDPPPPPPPLLPSAVTVSVASATAMEGDAVSFPVTLSGAAESDTVLGWTTAAGTATSGTDYTAVTAGTLTIAAEATTGMLTVATVEDMLAEGDETFTVTITGTTLPSGVTLGRMTATGTITDDENGNGGNGGNEGDGNNLVDNGGNGGKDGDGGTGETGDGGQTGILSSDVSLRDLILSHGTTVVPLVPAFLPETTLYTATVESDVPQLTVTATPNHSGAQIAYLDGDDKELTDSSASDNGFQVEVPVGDTVIQVKVTAEDGTTMQTYTVTVTRVLSSDVSLRDLILSHGTTVVPLVPAFLPETTLYTATVESDVPQLTVTATPNHSGAQIAYLDGDDKELTDSSASDNGFQVEVPVGDTVITVKVTAEDGSTMQTYTVTVTRVVGLARNREGVGHEWLARFARTVGTQVVNVVGERFVAPRRPGLAGQVAGHDLSRLVRASVQQDDEPEVQVRPGAGLAEYAPGRSNSRFLTARDFLSGTSFTLTMGQEDGLSAALWGRGAVMRFDGRDGDLLLDGEVSTGMLGVDYVRGAVTGGLLVSLNRGQGDYQSPTGDGELDSLLVGVYPYARVEVSERISAWGLFGHGRGNVTLSPASQSPISTDIGLHMGALGVEGMLSDSSGPTGLDLTVKSDAMWVKIESDEAVGLDSTHAKVSRLRLMLEGVRVFEVAPGATLTPSGQIGLRHDEGDAETGFGLDMSAGIRYAAGRLTIEGTVRTLVAHEDSAYEEWGASGAIRMTPDALGRGLSLTLAPAWGNTASKAEQLWAGQAPTGLATTGSTLPGTRLTAELGYGMVPADYRGILTPYAGFSLGNGSSQIYRTGARWQVAPETTLEFEASRGTAALSPAPVNSVMLHAAWRW